MLCCMQAQVAWKVLIMALICLATCLILSSTNLISEPFNSGCNDTVEACNGLHCMAVLSATQAVDIIGADFLNGPLATTMAIQVGKI